MKRKKRKKVYFHELTDWEAEHLSEKREKELKKCCNSFCFDCYGDRLR